MTMACATATMAVAALALAVALTATAAAPAVPAGVPVVVDAPAGAVAGLRRDGVDSFRGIRYGVAPVGPLRFEPSEPYSYAGRGINATRYAVVRCMPSHAVAGAWSPVGDLATSAAR